MEFRTFEFVGPSGNTYEIREQNGADEDILSNVADSKGLMNITKLIAAIVIKTNATPNGRLTIEDALNLPVNDRYCILFQSRIFSLGEEVEFEYDWGKGNGGKVTYSQDLTEYILDYSVAPSEEDLKNKPNAIPYYPEGYVVRDHRFTTTSGKTVSFDCLDGKGESRFIQLPLEKQTKNSPLICRNIKLEVDGKFEVIENFSLFSVKDMSEIRRAIFSIDPVFQGNSTITNPITGEESSYPITMAPSFFYLTEE